MKLYFLENGQKIDIYISSTTLGSPGGQGSVYKVDTSKYSDYCVKIYHSTSTWDPARIKYMIENQPQLLYSAQLRFKICWPLHLVYNSSTGLAVGYMMPLAFPQSQTLKILNSTHLKKTMREEFPNDQGWWKYDRADKKGMVNRFKIINNIAVAISYIHEINHYVIGDIKPENILSTHDGMISIIDTDSFQISDGTQMLFKGAAVTTEYFAPESYLRISNNLPLTISNDLFAIAICFYKMLIGCHPYAGMIQQPPYDKGSDLEYQIKNGLFAFGDKMNYLRATPIDVHKYFNLLPDRVQNLFRRAFSSSNTHHRATTIEWLKVLEDVINDSSLVKGNAISFKKSTTYIPQPGIKGIVIKDRFWSKYKRQVYIFLGIVSIAASIYYIYPHIVKKNNTTNETSIIEILYHKNVSVDGVYKVNVEIQNGDKIFMHAELIPTEEDGYIINLFEDTGQYTNNTLSVSIDDEGNAFSDFFGKGKITFNEKYNELELKFIDKNNIVWTFLK